MMMIRLTLQKCRLDSSVSVGASSLRYNLCPRPCSPTSAFATIWHPSPKLLSRVERAAECAMGVIHRFTLSRAAGVGDACVFAITEMQRKHEPKAYAGLAGISIVGALCARVAAVTERHRAPAAALRLAAPDVERVVRGLSGVFWECAKVGRFRALVEFSPLTDSTRLCSAGQALGRGRAVCDRPPWAASPSAREDCRGV